jgi:hypothetical protein
MKYELYSGVVVTEDFSVFEFVSLGHNGNIPKRVAFEPTHWPNVYNLAFGDITDDDKIDDLKISDNGDRNKILATILRIVKTYTEKYPDRWIYFIGSTEHRTRLYRMAVSLNLEELSTIFEIYAELKDQEEFASISERIEYQCVSS